MDRSKLLVVVFSLFMFQRIPCAFSQQASLSPSVLSFAPQVLNLLSPGSQPQTITLTNTGNADLIVSSVVASGGYKQTNNCSTLLSHQTCTIDVTFAPGTVQTINGAITVNDNAPSSPQVVSLNGKGIAPAVLSPGMVKFGTVAIGSTSQPQAVTLTAAPNSSFSINQISTSGEYAQTNNCPATLQNGQRCTIRVVFHPTANASVHGALAVSTASAGNVLLPLSVALVGSGSGNVVSQVSVQPANLNFGNKGPDIVDSVKELTLTNTSSNTSLNIQNVSLEGSPNAVGAFPMYSISSNTCSGLLSPGSQCTIGITFSTTFSLLFPQAYPGAVTITDSDPTSPQVIGISGSEVGQLTFGQSPLVFPTQSIGTTSQKTVTITGNDVQAGVFLSVATSGDFSEVGDLSPCFLKQGGKCSMTVSFTPTQTGTINGSVTLETYPQCNPDPLYRHKCPTPVVLNLSGTGQ
jgi:Protein of unknown function (DUF1573)